MCDRGSARCDSNRLGIPSLPFVLSGHFHPRGGHVVSLTRAPGDPLPQNSQQAEVEMQGSRALPLFPLSDERDRAKRAAIRRMSSKGTPADKIARFFRCSEETVRRIMRNDRYPYLDIAADDDVYLEVWDAGVMDVDELHMDDAAGTVLYSEDSDFRPGGESEGDDSSSGSEVTQTPPSRRASARLRGEPAPSTFCPAWIIAPMCCTR